METEGSTGPAGSYTPSYKAEVRLASTKRETADRLLLIKVEVI